MSWNDTLPPATRRLLERANHARQLISRGGDPAAMLAAVVWPTPEMIRLETQQAAEHHSEAA